MKNIFIIVITGYQKIVSPLLHQLLGVKSACRNNPTCSEYAKEVISHYGVVKGFLLSSRRVLNCQPFFSL
jgi:putative membrane protein insertion efficiency factor